MADKVDDINSAEFRKFLSRQLRKISYMWKPRNEALRAAKVSYGKYRCAECLQIHPKREIAIDHIQPVCPVTGFVDWNTEIERLFCPKQGFQVLCKPCHKIKTTAENKQRRLHKK